MTDILSAISLGGPAIWVIAALSILTLALILWKCADLLSLGAWRSSAVEYAVEQWCKTGRIMKLPRSALSDVVIAAFNAPATQRSQDTAREEITRIAQAHLMRASKGLRALELIATIAPLIGLLGTVLGMIDAFQALEESGAQADPGTLAGGIWEALLTTAAGMAVAIPASAALTGFEGVVDRLRHQMEDLSTRILLVHDHKGWT